MKKHRQNFCCYRLNLKDAILILRVNWKPTSDFDKQRRRKNYEKMQREITKKRRLKKVISTKARRKKKTKSHQVSACPDCGDFHFKKSDTCKVREMKVKMIVQQIMTHSKDIKVLI